MKLQKLTVQVQKSQLKSQRNILDKSKINNMNLYQNILGLIK